MATLIVDADNEWVINNGEKFMTNEFLNYFTPKQIKNPVTQ